MKSVTAYRTKTAACWVFACTSLAGTLAIAVGATSGSVSVPIFREWGLGAELTADAAVRRGQPRDLSLALNDKAIKASPMNAAAWLRVAYIRSGEAGPLDKTAVDAVRRSYSVAPFGPDVTAWRLKFLYGRWSSLPSDIRAYVIDEHKTYGRQVVIDSSVLTDPSGRLAAVMINATVRTRKTADRVKRENIAS